MKIFKGVVVGLLLGLVGCDPPGTTGLPLGESGVVKVKQATAIQPKIKTNGPLTLMVTSSQYHLQGIALRPYLNNEWKGLITPILAREGAHGDVDGDGITDLAIVDYTGQLALLSGKTHIWHKNIIPKPEYNTKLLMEDIDSNKKDDIIILKQQNNKISYYSDLNFSFNEITVPNIDIVYSIEVGDIDHDNKNDLIVYGSHGREENIIIRSSRQQKWLEPEPIPTTVSHLLLGDIDGDHQNDLVVYGDVLHFRSSQTQQWQELIPFEPVSTITAVAIGDTDNDGYKDLVISGLPTISPDPSVSVFIRSGLNENWTKNVVPNLKSISALQVSDIDGNGNNEILVGGEYEKDSQTMASVAIYDSLSKQWQTNDIPGFFRISQIATIPFEPSEPQSTIETAQIAIGSGNGVHIIKGQNALFTNKLNSTYSTVAAGDMNQDGNADIISLGNNISIFDGKTKNNLANFAHPTHMTDGGSITTGDLNKDGIQDIIIGAFGMNETFAEPQVIVFDGKTQTIMRQFSAYPKMFCVCGVIKVTSADMNLDSQPDIITSTSFGRIPLIRIFDGHSQTLLTEFFPQSIDIQTGMTLTTGDFNADSIPDIATGTDLYRPTQIIIYDGKTHAQIASFSPFTPDSDNGLALATGDYNNDGVIDLLAEGVSSGGQAMISVFDGRNFSNQLALFYIPFGGNNNPSVAMLSNHPKTTKSPTQP